MHLRRISLYGFKSFANETRIRLGPGLTALVGPNGGGKSNVVDAIRWALGEQRPRELRIERWTDLFYAGSGPRRPAQVAEVVLEFDNSDGAVPHWPETLVVGRRLFRSGDSEYLLNGRPVRLKDVTDAFLDSGLGQSPYAIIGQGRVEAVLLQRPKDRWDQLEEAAGATRYRVRRRETLAELERARADLRRAADLERDLRRQLEAVAPAADVERRARALAAERDRLERGLKAAEARRLAARLAALESARRAAAERAAALGRTRSEAEAETEAARAALEALEARLRTLEAAQRERERERERWRGRREALSDRRAQIETLRMAAEQARHAAREAFRRSQAERPVWRDPAEGEAIRRAAERLAAEVERLRAELAERERVLGEARHRAAALADRSRARERLLTQLRDLVGPVDDLEDASRRCRRFVEEAQARLSAVGAERALAAGQRQRLRDFVAAERQKLQARSERFAQREARWRVLKQLEAEAAGYAPGVRAVLEAQAAGKLTGVLGTVASVLRTEDRLRVALAAALGGRGQYLVVESERDARAAVRYLQARGLGRATFLPLDTVRPERPHPDDRDLVRQEGVVGWALDLVHVEARLRTAAAHVLGRVLVAERLDDAVAVGRLTGFRYRIVTLDGQVVQSGGAITGGSPARAEAAWGRREELERLEAELATERAQLEGAAELLAGAERELREQEARAEAVAADWQAAQDALAQAVATYRTVSALLANADEPVTADEVARAEAVVQELEAAWAASRAALDEAERVRAARSAEWAQWEAFRREQETLRAGWERSQAEAGARLAEAEERVRALSAERDELVREEHRVEAALAEVEEDLAALKAELADLAARADATRRVYAEGTERVARLRSEAEQLEREQSRAAVEIERTAGQLAALGEAARDEAVADEEAARSRLRALEAAERELGPVTPGSLALYEQLAARAEAVAAERQDIETALGELEATLADLDAAVGRRVREAQDRLEAAFAHTVAELLEGATGGFRRVEEPEPGLELWVRLPGKTPQALSALSGGEKALGALAWLFALLEVHPAPLVVLDEVEASLDEANARRFAQFLARRRHVQYLVVTHQKSTMEQADVLLGLTTDRHGVSRPVAVRLAAGEDGTDDAERTDSLEA
ncbi:MAG: chromosome segregation protein SMC [Actinomycetia bacterium]|nr:chromosome segregation protein SMC [Actinomycetes bacterium]